MHSIFVVMILAVGVDQGVIAGGQPAPFDAQPSPTIVGGPSQYHPEVPGPYHYDPPRDPQESDGLVRGFFMYFKAWWQPMPQTCYAPHFGCYPGNGRDIYRYPAFHGYYYRQAYNYRPLYEYPWQAGMQEPMPLELSSERSMIGNPHGSEHVEVIETPTTNSPHPVQ